MFRSKCYIIRKGDFAIDANKKIFYTMFSLVMCIEDYIRRNSTECFAIMLGSTLIWTAIETYLHISNTRVMKPMYITFINDSKYEIPKSMALCLQGSQEGGVVTTFGLFFGDRIYDFSYMCLFHLFLGYIMLNLISKESLPQRARVSSKRQIDTPGSLGIMGSITAYNGYMLYRHPQHLQRQLQMFLAMIYVCSVWTIISYYKNFRGVEIEIMGKNGRYYTKRRTILDAFLILGYDVIFEIGIAYITFYNLFII